MVEERSATSLGWYDDRGIPGPRLNLKNFGDVPAPSTIPDFLAVASAISAADMRIAGWRGQSQGWKVEPGATRRVRNPWAGARPKWMRAVDDVLAALNVDETEASDNTTPPAYVVQHYLRRLIDDAKQRGFGIHEGQNLSDLEILALLQHHGAATNLLDVTRNILFALWIASIGDVGETGVVIAVSRDQLTPLSAEGVQQPLADLLKEPQKGRATLYYWTPRVTTPRIQSQQGSFLFSRDVDEPWGTMAMKGTYVWTSEVEDGRFDYSDLDAYFIAITPKLKGSVIRACETGLLGFDNASVFPDVPGFAMAHSSGEAIPYRKV